jgi:putative Mn2+ efflux pump MntP
VVGTVLVVVALILAALAIGLDNFGAAVGLGLSAPGPSLRWRVALVFGFFEAAMPLVGFVLGRALAHGLGQGASVIGGTLVAVVGLYTVVQAWRAQPMPEVPPPTGTWRLIALGAALSLDNLAIGFALGAYRVDVLAAVLVIALVSVALSLVGLELGRRLVGRVGERAELVGGGVMILVGILIATRVL